MSADSWTIRRLLEWTETFLRDKGIESPRLEAQLLLAHTLGCKKIDLYVRSNDEPSDQERTHFKALIKKRVDGCPVAYLVGQREFYRLSFDVSPAVLIPRPETEFVVLEGLRLLKGKDKPSVLDVGTGSGCIALSIAQQHKSACVTASDISSAALGVARQNAERHGLAQRVRFVESDAFDSLPGERFDLIASNPPYVADSEMATLDKEVRDFEPRLALDGGADGLTIYRRLIAQSPEHLRSGGHLLLEIGSTQETAVHGLVEATGQFDPIVTLLDGQKLPRVIVARKK